MKLLQHFILLLLMTFPLSAAEILTEEVVDSSLVNDIFVLLVEVETDSSQKVIPVENEGWYRSIQMTGIAAKEVSNTLTEVRFVMKGFAPQLCSIPSFELYIVPIDSTDTSAVDTLTTTAVAVNIISRLTVPVDSLVSAGFNHPMKAGEFPWQKLLVIIISTVLIVLIVVIVVRWIVMKIQNRDIFGKPLEPETPPYDEAQNSLKWFELCTLESAEDLKEATFVLSDIVKRYIGRRFECQVQESTSTEFRAWIRESDLTREQNNLLERFIAETDPVKFANITPSRSVVTELLSDIKQFIDETKPEIEEDKK